MGVADASGAAGTMGVAGASGAAGTMGVAGASGIAGTSGTAGSTGAAGGTGGTLGSAPPSCDIKPIVDNYFCSVAGACHDAQGSAAGLVLTSIAAFQSLVGRQSQGGGQSATRSMCGGQGRYYLVPGKLPATGLLLEKLGAISPPCGGQMPSIGGPLTTAERDCFQRWANFQVWSRAGAH
jgi:hypothetical protein